MLFKRNKTCDSGNSQMCVTGNEFSTLAICLVVILPVVFVCIIVGFFVWKAYRRDKKELEDDDPDFNVDNIVMPDIETGFPQEFNPSQHNLMSNFNKSAFSLQNQMRQNQMRPPLKSKQSFANSLDTFQIPMGNSKQDVSRFSKSLGYDFQDFNYPIKKMNSSPIKSLETSRVASQRSSFSINSRPLTGYENSFNSTDQNFSGKVDEVHPNELAVDSTPENEDIFDEKKSMQEEDPSAWENTSVKGKQLSPHQSINFEDEIKSAEKQTIDPTALDNKSQADSNINAEPQQSDPSLESSNLVNNNLDAEPLLSPEEEEQLNRMKSVYNVYFSRGDSVKRPKEANNIDKGIYPPLPKISVDDEIDALDSEEENNDPFVDASTNSASAETKTDQKSMKLEVNDNDVDPARASISSSIYVSNTSAVPAGQYAHQQLSNLVSDQQPIPPPSAASAARNNQYYDPNQQYYDPNQQYYDPNQQYYDPNQQYYDPNQQYYDPNQQYYDPNQQFYQPQQRGHPLPKTNKLSNIPSPHQLAKRTSTLETFTTFKNQTYKQNVSKPSVRIDQNFHPIDHGTWATIPRNNSNSLPSNSSLDSLGIKRDAWKGGLESQPSPSQLRDSVVMLNPVEIGGRKLHEYKGTAKEQVRQITRQATYEQQYQEPLYGFVDGFERPHGAENLLPRSKSGDVRGLRRDLDNANV